MVLLPEEAINTPNKNLFATGGLDGLIFCARFIRVNQRHCMIEAQGHT